MAEAETLEQKTNPENAQASNVGLLIALPACANQEILLSLIARISQALAGLSTSYTVGIALPMEVAAMYQETTQNRPDTLPLFPLSFFGYTIPASNSATLPWLGQALTTDALIAFADKAAARASTVLGAEACGSPEFLTLERISLLLEPCIEGGIDLVMPLYTTPAYDDLLNKAILYPLTRALYGRRIRYPLASEFQLSSKLMYCMRGRTGKDSLLQAGRLLWLGSTAAQNHLKICQVYVGARSPQNYDGIELSDALAQMAGGLFLDMEDNAMAWQRVRGSTEVPTFGVFEAPPESLKAMDVRRMVEAFQLGVRNLHEIWSLILPPATLLDLKKLSLLAPDDFRMSDGLWARIVYDFALAHRLRNVHRTHLFGALKPLYLGWVASYVNDVSREGTAVAEERVETLARVFEAEKSYLVSRWRWPDRFHP